MSTIAYSIGDALYLNITNRCTNECEFCIRYKTNKFNGQHDLWLDHEPTAAEVIEAIGDPTKHKQIVFCGYGEPLLRLDIVKEVAMSIKTYEPTGLRTYEPNIRIDTNGHANLYWERNVLPELKGLIDHISISLVAQNAKVYDRLCHSIYGEAAYPAVLEFIKEAKKYIPIVEASVVDLPEIDKLACDKIAQELGVKFRLRTYYEEKYVR